MLDVYYQAAFAYNIKNMSVIQFFLEVIEPSYPENQQ